MEPVAIAFNYWGWQGGAPPVQNYIIWGVISGVMCSLYLLFRCNAQKALPAYYLGIQFVYFLILKFIV
jgi:putative membrane protein